MEDLRQQQLEALQAAGEYIEKLIPGIETVVKELEGGRKEDTEEFMKQCLDGLNWVIEIYNRVTDVLVESMIVIDKNQVNENIMALGKALSEKCDEKTAAVLTGGIIPFLSQIREAAAAM